jgi:hypothetical protein
VRSGVCVDAPDRELRVLLKFCEKGSVFDFISRKLVHAKVEGRDPMVRVLGCNLQC